MLAFFGRYDYEMDIKLNHLVLKKGPTINLK